MLDFIRKSRYDASDLVTLVRLLRGPGGCPWDRAQTHQSIRRNLLEEAYAACEALDQDDPDHMKEELGDVLLQVVFHAGIEQDAGRFDLDDVCDAVCQRLIQRHPHLFYENTERADWEEVKRHLRGDQSVAQDMEGVSKALPALWQADKILSKAEKSGLYQDSAACAMEDLTQIVADLAQAGARADSIGTALFTLARLSRLSGIDPEMALSQSCKQFIGDFSQREQAAAGADCAPQPNQRQKEVTT